MGKKRILIVDDDVRLSRKLHLDLQREGEYEVRVANSGGAGLKEARKFGPDLILLDLMILDVNGKDIAERLAGDPRTRDIPIIMFTSLVQKAEVEMYGADYGGCTILAKPVEASEAIQAIEKRLAQSPPQPF